MPRIITVDPTSSVSRLVRSAIDLLELSVIQVDAPNATDALDELARGANLVVSSFLPASNMKGFEFALRVKQAAKDASVLILGDEDDPEDLDEETTLNSPFVYMHRPVDIHQFLRVLVAGLESHEAMIAALHGPAAGVTVTATQDLGPVPGINDMGRVEVITDQLLRDLGAMAIIFGSRAGEALIERGAIGDIDRDELMQVLSPVMNTSINVKDVVGGQVTTVQLYDGDNYDIFVLSVGLHHLLTLIFDGQNGSKQFGAVNRFGRRAVEELIALLGANAFFLQPPSIVKEEPAKRTRSVKKVDEIDEPIHLERAQIDLTPEPEPALEQLEPLADVDMDALFGGDVALEGDMFDMENLGQIVKEGQQKGKSSLDWDEAQQLGILGN